MAIEEEFDDNRNQDPDFEPQKKKHKKNGDFISNDLMLYVINGFGKEFYGESDRVERKLMCEMIRDDLINEKSTVIEADINYDNLMNLKRTFLREKKKNPQHVKWPFFDVFMSLGSIVRSESSSDRKSSSSKSSKSHSSKSSSSSSRKSSSHKDSKKSNKNDSIISANESQTDIGLKAMFGGSIVEASSPIDKNAGKGKQDDKKGALNISLTPTTSKSFNVLHSTPKSETPTSSRPRGYMFDNSVDVKDKLGLFFGKCEASQEIVGYKEPPTEFANQEEMIAYLDTLIPKSPSKEKAEIVEESVNTQVDPMDYINPTQSDEGDIFASQFPATQQFPESQEIDEIRHNNTEEDLDSTADKTIEDGDETIEDSDKTIEADDKNGPEKMAIDEDEAPINDSKEKTLNSIMNEVLEHKSFGKIDEAVGAKSEQIKELKELFNENESLVAAMLELEEKLFKIQNEIVKSELKFKAKLVEVLGNIL